MNKSFIFNAVLMLVAFGAGSCSTGSDKDISQKNIDYKSTELLDNGKVAFRLYAPEAEAVSFSGDLAERIPVNMARNAEGVWEVVMEGVEPGVYRYYFNVDGVKTIDPRSEQAIETYSLLKYSPEGDEFFALRDVPHGALVQRYYKSNSAGCVRRLHLWTPPGYEKMNNKLPVFYLVHGGGDNDSGWAQLGAANLILDNLYAEGKIVPMVVVMPDGHIDSDVFVKDLCTDVVPFIEENYNVYSDPSHRALGGLSNGGLQTMKVILGPHQMFDTYLVLSSGWFPQREEEYSANVKKLNSVAEELNKHVKMLIFTQGGPEDIAYENGQKTVAEFAKAGVKYEYTEGPGGHTWYTWRYNLRDLAPRLFR